MKFFYIIILGCCFLNNIAQQRHFHSTNYVSVVDGAEMNASIGTGGEGYLITLDSVSLTTHFEGKMMIKKKISKNEFEVLLNNKLYNVLITEEQIRIQMVGDLYYKEKLIGYYLD